MNKVYTVWCFDPCAFDQATLIKVFKSKKSAELFAAKKNKEEMGSYSYGMEEEELHD